MPMPQQRRRGFVGAIPQVCSFPPLTWTNEGPVAASAVVTTGSTGAVGESVLSLQATSAVREMDSKLRCIVHDCMVLSPTSDPRPMPTANQVDVKCLPGPKFPIWPPSLAMRPLHFTFLNFAAWHPGRLGKHHHPSSLRVRTRSSVDGPVPDS